MQNLSEGSEESDLGEQAERRTWTAQKQAERSNEGCKQMPDLAKTIETEIIPRLMLALGAAVRADPAAPVDRRGFVQADVTEFVSMVLDSELAILVAHIDTFRSRGVSVDAIYLDLLAPTARELGMLWEADKCDFTQVTIGLSRLQSLLHEVSLTTLTDSSRPENGHRALLVPLPGEQHTFGLAIVMDFFWRAGWDIRGGPITSVRELLTMVRDNWFDVVGLSLGSEKWLDETLAEIRQIRRESRNPSVGILVGGPVFIGHPERVLLVGADGWADDARDAPRRAEMLLAELEGRRSSAAVGKYF